MRADLRDFPYRGSVSSGTLRPADLLPTFMSVLRKLDPEQAAAWWDEERRYTNAFDGTYDADPEYTAEDVARLQDEGTAFLAEVTEAIEALTPEELRFGAHEGDGAEFGFWVADEDAPHVGHYSRLGGQYWCDTCNSPLCDLA